MTRTASATVQAAVALDATQPIYLIRMGWDLASPDVNRRIATWDRDISWNSETWEASGASIERLDANGGTLRLPNGDGDPWLSLVMTQGQRGKTFQVYEYHRDSSTSPHSYDAVELFEGLMDSADISDRGIRINFIAGLLNKTFPHTSITTAEYPYLLTDGDRMYWGPDVIRVE